MKAIRFLQPVVALLILVSCGGGGEQIERWSDLLLRLPERIEVRNLAGDRRASLLLGADTPLAFRSLEGGQDCRLKLAYGVGPEETGRRLQVSLESWSESHLVFDRDLEPRAETPQWREVEIELGRQQGSFHLELEAEGGPLAIANLATLCGATRPPRRDPRPHILLVSIDTLRRDRLGVYGHHRDTTPAIDELARQALVFEAAFAVAPWTLPSHASIFTGLYPEQHGAGHASSTTPLDEVPGTLATWLSDAGYRTVGISAGGFAGRHFGLDRGFDLWVEHERAALQSSIPTAMQSLSEASDPPLFLFLHTFDVHGPYLDSALYPPFEPLPLPEDREALWRELRNESLHAYLEPERFASLAELDAAYDTGIASVDEQLGVIFRAIEDLDMLDEILIIITSDHGESLLEHGDYVGHSFSMHDEELAIPLIVRFPNGEPSGRRSGLVDHTDLAPMILRAAGIEPPDLAGDSPLERLEGRLEGRRWIRGEAINLGALYARNESWMLTTAPGRAWPADRRLPPGITRRLDRKESQWRSLGGHPDLAAGREALVEVLESIDDPARGTQPESVDPELRSRLEALGYLQPD